MAKMLGVVQQIVDGRVAIESVGGDILYFEPHDGDAFLPLDLLHWAEGPIFNWSQNKHVDGRWVSEQAAGG